MGVDFFTCGNDDCKKISNDHAEEWIRCVSCHTKFCFDCADFNAMFTCVECRDNAGDNDGDNYLECAIWTCRNTHVKRMCLGCARWVCADHERVFLEALDWEETPPTDADLDKRLVGILDCDSVCCLNDTRHRFTSANKFPEGVTPDEFFHFKRQRSCPFCVSREPSTKHAPPPPLCVRCCARAPLEATTSCDGCAKSSIEPGTLRFCASHATLHRCSEIQANRAWKNRMKSERSELAFEVFDYLGGQKFSKRRKLKKIIAAIDEDRKRKRDSLGDDDCALSTV